MMVLDLAHQAQFGPAHALVGSRRQRLAEDWLRRCKLLKLDAERSCLVRGPAGADATGIEELAARLVAEQERTDGSACRRRWNVTEDRELLALEALAPEPVLASSRPVGEVLAFGHDPFQSKPARMLEQGRSVLLQMLTEPDRRTDGQSPDQPLEQGLALDQMHARQVEPVAVEDIEDMIAEPVLTAGLQV